jgi:hypothetical protein
MYYRAVSIPWAFAPLRPVRLSRRPLPRAVAGLTRIIFRRLCTDRHTTCRHDAALLPCNLRVCHRLVLYSAFFAILTQSACVCAQRDWFGNTAQRRCLQRSTGHGTSWHGAVCRDADARILHRDRVCCLDASFCSRRCVTIVVFALSVVSATSAAHHLANLW